MNPYVLLAIAVAWAGSCWYAYDAGGDNRENAIIADQAATETLIHDTATSVRQEIGAEVAGRIDKIRIVNRTVNQESVREIIEKPVYRDPDCAVPVSGVVHLNAARRGEPGGAGPGNDAAKPAAADIRPKPPAAAGGPPPR